MNSRASLWEGKWKVITQVFPYLRLLARVASIVISSARSSQLNHSTMLLIPVLQRQKNELSAAVQFDTFAGRQGHIAKTLHHPPVRMIPIDHFHESVLPENRCLAWNTIYHLIFSKEASFSRCLMEGRHDLYSPRTVTLPPPSCGNMMTAM